MLAVCFTLCDVSFHRKYLDIVNIFVLCRYFVLFLYWTHSIPWANFQKNTFIENLLPYIYFYLQEKLKDPFSTTSQKIFKWPNLFLFSKYTDGNQIKISFYWLVIRKLSENLLGSTNYKSSSPDKSAIQLQDLGPLWPYHLVDTRISSSYYFSVSLNTMHALIPGFVNDCQIFVVR